MDGREELKPRKRPMERFADWLKRLPFYIKFKDPAGRDGIEVGIRIDF